MIHIATSDLGRHKPKTTSVVERIPYRWGKSSLSSTQRQVIPLQYEYVTESQGLLESLALVENFRKFSDQESAKLNFVSVKQPQGHVSDATANAPVNSDLPALFGAYKKKFVELGFDPHLRSIGYDVLVECCLQKKTDLKISISIDKEILIYRETPTGYHNITIDEDGDLSFVRLSRGDDGPMSKMYFRGDGHSDETYREIVALL
jgi:hypothetical protein